MTIVEMFSLLGGVGLFLFGMTMMSSGLKGACGDNLQGILERATKNKLLAVGVGILVTMLIQSSSATDVMVIGFVNSGLMTLYQAIGVIMGANIGTTITAQMTAFNLSTYTPFILFVGAVLYLFVKKELLKYIGSVLMGFGMLFQGIGMMKSAIAPLAQSQAFITFISALSNPLVTVLFGVAFTALLQSSSSATVIFQAFAVQGIIDYKICVYLVIGAAIGSVTPNLLASLTTNRNGKRSAILNLLFNIFRAVILLTLITIFPVILELIQKLSPGDVGRQIANTHTIFAIFAVLVMLPFSDFIVKLSMKILPELPEEKREQEERQLLYMVNTTNIPTALAVTQAKQEIGRMASLAYNNLEMALQSFFEQNAEKAELVLEREETVNYLNNAIIDKLVELNTMTMSQKDMNKIYHLILTVTDLERISDHAENIIEYARDLQERQVALSEEAKKELKIMGEQCLESVQESISIFVTEEYERLPEAQRLEEIVDDTEEKVVNAHIQRVMDGICSPQADVIFKDMTSDLERCSDHAINIAFSLTELNEADIENPK
ncbi:MAG: Na/Pi cotransporter family protein [Lachnospiraceae bacterium]